MLWLLRRVADGIELVGHSLSGLGTGLMRLAELGMRLTNGEEAAREMRRQNDLLLGNSVPEHPDEIEAAAKAHTEKSEWFTSRARPSGYRRPRPFLSS